MKQETIVNARTKLAAALPSTTQILRGSLLHRRIRIAPAAPSVLAVRATLSGY